MVYAYDQALQLPTVDLYDTLMMAMAVNAAKDMYDRGQELVKEFYKTYGDFMSPFAKDMERYGLMMGNVRNLINDAYARGIDLARSPEGRALIQRAVYSVNPYEYNLMRSNAKTGYAYLDAMQKLRSLGKYSEAQELYDIMQSGGTNFSDFSTFDRNGAHVWDRTSPIEATSLLDLTFNSYKNRTPRDLTAADFIESNGLTPGMFDKRYQYTGYLDSDLMKVAPGAAMSIAADPRAAYFRNLAEQKVAARGGNYTLADVDAQFYRDIADANRWALVDPVKQENKYELANYTSQLNIAANREQALLANRLKHDLDGDGEISPEEAMLAKLAAEAKIYKDLYGGGGNGKRRNGLFQYGEATQEQAIMRLVESLVGTMDEVDPKTGKTRKVTVENANPDTVLRTYSSSILTPYRKYMRNLFNSHIKYKDPENKNESGTHGRHAMDQYVKKFGYIDTPNGFAASMGYKDTDKEIPFTAADIDNVYTDAEVLAMADGYRGFKKGWTHKQEIERTLANRRSNGFASSDAALLYGNDASGFMEPIKGTTDMPNKIPVILKDGSMIMLRAINIKYGNKTGYSNTGRMWVQTGSPTYPKNYVNTENGVKIAGLNPYTRESLSLSQIEENAKYSQATGSLKNQNVSLPTDVPEDVDEETVSELVKMLKSLQ